MNNFKKKVFF